MTAGSQVGQAVINQLRIHDRRTSVQQALVDEDGRFAALATFGNQPLPAGIQRYSVRNAVMKHPGETLQAISAIGYR